MFDPGDGMIFIGDATTHGGRVISGQPNYTVNGLAAAVVGDMVACPKKGHGVCPIIEGHPTIIINGKQAAFHGCHTGCGAQLIASQASMHHLGGDETPTRARALTSAQQYSPQSATPASFTPEGRSTDQKGMWVPVEADFPALIYQTQRRMNDSSAPDMLYKDESKEQIEQYGFDQPFKQSVYHSYPQGYTIHGEDQFSLPVEEHFDRMRGLKSIFSWKGDTQNIFGELVDKFESNQGGHYKSSLLSRALRQDSTTKEFHSSLTSFIKDYLKNNAYILDETILSQSARHLSSSEHAVGLPKFNISNNMANNLINGTVVSVHDIWALEVYADSLERHTETGQIRGSLRYVAQDHFGLDRPDIDHPSFSSINKYELLEGFRSWYLLQHYVGYGYKPVFTDMEFTLDIVED